MEIRLRAVANFACVFIDFGGVDDIRLLCGQSLLKRKQQKPYRLYTFCPRLTTTFTAVYCFDIPTSNWITFVTWQENKQTSQKHEENQKLNKEENAP